MAALILFLLAWVMFDGLLATPVWAAIAARFRLGAIVGETVCLLAMWRLFNASYAAVSLAMAAASRGEHSADEIGRAFA